MKKIKIGLDLLAGFLGILAFFVFILFMYSVYTEIGSQFYFWDYCSFLIAPTLALSYFLFFSIRILRGIKKEYLKNKLDNNSYSCQDIASHHLECGVD